MQEPRVVDDRHVSEVPGYLERLLRRQQGLYESLLCLSDAPAREHAGRIVTKC